MRLSLMRDGEREALLGRDSVVFLSLTLMYTLVKKFIEPGKEFHQ